MDPSSTQYLSSLQEHSINSTARINRIEIGAQTKSLAQCCPKTVCSFIPVLVILGIFALMVQEGLNCHTTITDINITVKSSSLKPPPPSLSVLSLYGDYEDDRTVNGPSIPESIEWFWNGDAKYNAVINGFCSMFLPFSSGVLLLHLFFVRFRLRNQQYRTLWLVLVMQTGKFTFTQAFCGMFDGIVNFVDIDTASFQFEIISAPADAFANYTTLSAAFGAIALVLLCMDQMYMYNDDMVHGEPVAAAGIASSRASRPCSYYKHIECVHGDSWFCLFFAKKRESVLGVCRACGGSDRAMGS